VRAQGIDLSEWDLRPLNWGMASKVLSFAFIKISQGTDPDPLFRAQWESAEGWVLRGFYHFFDPRVDPGRSVDKTIEFKKIVSPGELPPAFDLEETFGRSDTLERSRAWLEIYEDKTGVRPIIYSSKPFLEAIGVGKRGSEWIRDYPLWFAAWPYDKMSDAERKIRIAQVFRGEILVPYPVSPPPWTMRPDWYQWTSRGDPGDIPGYYMGIGHKKAVDLIYYFGTEAELFQRYGTPPKRLGNGEVNLYKYSITPISKDGLKVRMDHYVVDYPSQNRIGSLEFGRFAFGNETWEAQSDGSNYKKGDKWLKVLSVDGEPIPGWMAVIHNGTPYGKLAPINPETPPEEPPTASIALSLDIQAEVTQDGLRVDVSASSFGYVSAGSSFTLPKE
jgi:GH25 family lysozyme M1 (1,4-beta-N-acetylmuramidase)